MNKTAKHEKTQTVLMEESRQEQPSHVPGDGKKGGEPGAVPDTSHSHTRHC